MAVFRVERNSNYTTMSNYHLRDQNLSLKAKGLLSMFLSLPDDWHYSISGLVRITKEGKGAITTAVRELEKAGYLIRKQERLPNGTVGNIEYVIFERPQEEKVDSCGVRLVKYGDGAVSQDEERSKERMDTEQEGEAEEDFEWDAGEQTDVRPAEDTPATGKAVMGKTAAGKPPAGVPVAKNPAAEKPEPYNAAEGNPAGLITNQTITNRPNTKGIKDEGIKGGQQFRRYGTFGNVFLTDNDLARLRTEFPSDYIRRIERLSEYMATTGKRYDDHLSTIERWSRWDAEKPLQSQAQGRSYSHERYRFREGDSL